MVAGTATATAAALVTDRAMLRRAGVMFPRKCMMKLRLERSFQDMDYSGKWFQKSDPDEVTVISARWIRLLGETENRKDLEELLMRNAEKEKEGQSDAL